MRKLTSLRNRTLLTAISIVCLSATLLPDVRCKSGECVLAAGRFCWDGTQWLAGYKSIIGYEG